MHVTRLTSVFRLALSASCMSNHQSRSSSAHTAVPLLPAPPALSAARSHLRRSFASHIALRELPDESARLNESRRSTGTGGAAEGDRWRVVSCGGKGGCARGRIGHGAHVRSRLFARAHARTPTPTQPPSLPHHPHHLPASGVAAASVVAISLSMCGGTTSSTRLLASRPLLNISLPNANPRLPEPSSDAPEPEPEADPDPEAGPDPGAEPEAVAEALRSLSRPCKLDVACASDVGRRPPFTFGTVVTVNGPPAPAPASASASAPAPALPFTPADLFRAKRASKLGLRPPFIVGSLAPRFRRWALPELLVWLLAGAAEAEPAEAAAAAATAEAVEVPVDTAPGVGRERLGVILRLSASKSWSKFTASPPTT